MKRGDQMKERSYWICITNSENFDIIRTKKVWGVKSYYKKQIEQVNTGDNLIFYIIGQKLGGIFVATSECYYDGKSIFRGGTFPHQIKIKPEILPDSPIDFTPELRENLSFINNKRKWMAYFRRAMLLINDEDFGVIVDYIKKHM